MSGSINYIYVATQLLDGNTISVMPKDWELLDKFSTIPDGPEKMAAFQRLMTSHQYFNLMFDLSMLDTLGRMPSMKGWATRAIRIPGFTQVESDIIAEADSILSSPQLRVLRQAYRDGVPVKIEINGRMIQYEPNLADSGLSMFGNNGFLIGRNAFSSSTEFTKTILHELQRLYTTQSAAGVSGELARIENEAARSFADRAFEYIKTAPR